MLNTSNRCSADKGNQCEHRQSNTGFGEVILHDTKEHKGVHQRGARKIHDGVLHRRRIFVTFRARGRNLRTSSPLLAVSQSNQSPPGQMKKEERK